MSLKFLTIVSLILSVYFFHAQSIPGDFIQNSDSVEFKELFTVNTAVMRLKSRGNINEINHVDSDNIVKLLRGALENISVCGMDHQTSLIKTLSYIAAKNQAQKNAINHLIAKIRISPRQSETFYMKEVIKLMSQTPSLQAQRTKWFENYSRSVYTHIIHKDIIDYTVGDYKKICEKSTTPPDFLITGDIEKVNARYVITLIFYSYHKNAVVYKTAFASNIDKISDNIEKAMRTAVTYIFNTAYAELTINTDENTEILINNKYLSKGTIYLSYVVPGTYSLSMRKENTQAHSEIITVTSNEKKSIEIIPQVLVPKQQFSVHIEPPGTRIFINSRYSGTTPFKTELPQGEYILSAKPSELYENYRYTLHVDSVENEEKSIQFHLMTRDINTYLSMKRNIYYAAFWNFTFTLSVFVPLTIVAVQYYPAPTMLTNLTEDLRSLNDNNPSKQKTNAAINDMKNVALILQVSSIAMAVNTVASLGWLFFSLFDYIGTLEKKDFIPILHYYSSPEESGIVVGGSIPIETPKTE